MRRPRPDLFRLAATQGHVRAQYNLGQSYLQGVGIEKDEIESVRWFRRAADRGFYRAQYRLGQAYRKGLGVPVNLKTALKWYWDAAHQGDAPAYYRLGRAYEYGEGVKKELVEALRWFLLATGNSKGELLKVSRHRVVSVAAILSKDQVEEARKRAASWRPKKTRRTE